MMFQHYKFLIGLAFLLIMNGCTILQPNRMLETPKDFKYSPFEKTEIEYRIKPYDKLSVSISTNDGYQMISIAEGNRNQNPKGEIEFLVEFDGQVKLPTLGRVHVAGLTLREAEKKLEELYSVHYQNPFVLLKVINRRVYVFKSGGEIGTVINIPEDNLTLLEALAMAGGLTENDKAYQIKVIRGNPAENPRVFLYNIRKIDDLQGTNLQLEANDIIHIERRPRYIRSVMNELSPYFSLLSTILLIVNLASNGK